MALFKSRSQLPLLFFFRFLFDYLARSYTTGLLLTLRFFDAGLLGCYSDITRMNHIVINTNIYPSLFHSSARSLNLHISRPVTSQIRIWHGYLFEFILRFRNRRDSSDNVEKSASPFKLALATNFYPNQNRRLTRIIYYRIFIRILLG